MRRHGDAPPRRCGRRSSVGYLAVLLVALDLFEVPVGHLLVGGAVTGVVVGIAAQQSLGNLFAGLVLLFVAAVHAG